MFKNTPNDTKTSSDPIGQNKKEWGYDIKDVDVKEYNRLSVPIVLQAENCTFEDIRIHALLRQRLNEGTIKRNLRYLRFMELHECPVDFRNPSYENFIRHMDYREQVEGKGWGALKHEWQAMMMYLRAIGINPREWQYRPPPRAKYTTRKIPTPEQIYKIFRIQYHKDKEKNACIKYPIVHSFLIGWRVPSEPTIAKTTDIDLEEKTMKITSTKLYNATRYIDISEIIKPIKEWIEKWRPQIENQHSQDALYLHFDGRPFENAEQLRKFLNTYAASKVKQVFPEYYNYLTRHWVAIARLIKAKVETNHYDVYDVKEWMGHTKIETTMGYVQDAKFYYKKYPFDWIKRVLKYYNNEEIIGENTLKKEEINGTWRFNPSEFSLFRSRRLPRSYRQSLLKNPLFFFYENQVKNILLSFYTNQAFFIGVSGSENGQDKARINATLDNLFFHNVLPPPIGSSLIFSLKFHGNVSQATSFVICSNTCASLNIVWLSYNIEDGKPCFSLSSCLSSSIIAIFYIPSLQGNNSREKREKPSKKIKNLETSTILVFLGRCLPSLFSTYPPCSLLCYTQEGDNKKNWVANFILLIPISPTQCLYSPLLSVVTLPTTPIREVIV